MCEAKRRHFSCSRSALTCAFIKGYTHIITGLKFCAAMLTWLLNGFIQPELLALLLKNLEFGVIVLLLALLGLVTLG